MKISRVGVDLAKQRSVTHRLKRSSRCLWVRLHRGVAEAAWSGRGADPARRHPLALKKYETNGDQTRSLECYCSYLLTAAGLPSTTR